MANVPNGNASITGGWPYPMPAEATLRWETESQTQYIAAVTIPSPPNGQARSLKYMFVLLPEGRANVAVAARNSSTDDNVTRSLAVYYALGRDGGPNYRVAVKNTTGMKVHGLDVRFGPYAVNAGTHLRNRGQTHSIATGLPYPVTKSASLRWITKDDKEWAKVVDIEDVLPPDLNDKCLWFILKREGDVEVQIVTWDDLRAGKHPELCHGF